MFRPSRGPWTGRRMASHQVRTMTLCMLRGGQLTGYQGRPRSVVGIRLSVEVQVHGDAVLEAVTRRRARNADYFWPASLSSCSTYCFSRIPFQALWLHSRDRAHTAGHGFRRLCGALPLHAYYHRRVFVLAAAAMRHATRRSASEAIWPPPSHSRDISLYVD